VRRRTLAALTGVVIGISGGVVTASPAQAAWSDCANYPGTICLFAHANFGTPIWRQFPSEINGGSGCRDLTGFNDVTTIAANQAPHYSVRLWQHAGCTGTEVILPNVGSYIGFSGSGFNDQASSIEVIPL
jgi:hypothetical protein